MIKKKTSEVADLLDINVGRLEQWLAHKAFDPLRFESMDLSLQPVERGKPRMWSFAQALQLAIFVRLVDVVGMSAEDAGRVTQIGFTAGNEKPAFFVAYQISSEAGLFPESTWFHKVVPASELGNFLARECPVPTPLIEGFQRRCAPASAAVVLNLDDIADELKSAWVTDET
jgi:hypothetical protein